MSHHDDDVRARFEALRGSLSPLDGAPAAIDRAVARRRRRPLVVGSSLTAVAGAAVLAVATLPGLGWFPAASSTASFATEAATGASTHDPGGPSVGFAPVEMSGGTVGEWAAGADVVVVVEADGDAAEVIEVTWRRAAQPGDFDLDSLPLGEDDEIALGTATGSPASTSLSPTRDHLVALRWERVRCDGAAPGWVTLGDEAVLELTDDGSVRRRAHAEGEAYHAEGPLPRLEAEVATAFGGLTGPEVASVLDGLGLERSRDLCA